MHSARAIEIIAAYGAEEGRWPESERAGVVGLAQRDPAVRAALAEARALDRAIAVMVAPAGPFSPRLDDQAAAAAALKAGEVRHMPAGRPRRWLWGGAAVAAGLAAAVLIAQPEPARVAAPVAGPDTAVAATVAPANGPASEDAELFALMFTATTDEDLL